MSASGGHVLLVLTGSVAAIKVVELVAAFEARGLEVRIVASKPGLVFAATRLLHEPALALRTLRAALPGLRATWTEWPRALSLAKGRVEHVALAKWADVIAIAPASASTLGKLASGITDSFALCVVRALPRDRNVIVAPAMNTEMWFDPFVQRAVADLEHSGKYRVVPPRTSLLLCGDEGVGAMADPDTIADHVVSNLHPSDP